MNKDFVIITLIVFSSAWSALAFADGESNSSSAAPAITVPLLVEIDGVKLSVIDYERKHPGGLFQARNIFYQAERKLVENYIDEYLLDREAQKENVTVAQLLDRHVNSTVPKEDPPEVALRVYYEGVETTEPYEKVRDQIAAHIHEVRVGKAKAAYMRSLHSQAKVNVLFGQPRAQIDMKESPVRGRADAGVVVVEYADYECPYCQKAQAGLDQIEAEYKGKIAFVYKDMPLPNHGHAQKAAEAAQCAAVQGKYWEYHDLLFKSRELDMPQLKEHARALGLDGASFDKCLDSGEKAEGVKAGYSEGVGLGLEGTPGFFINGRLFNGILTRDQLHLVIEDELAMSAARGKETAKAEK
jgi:protein-disulfide isomerase